MFCDTIAWKFIALKWLIKGERGRERGVREETERESGRKIDGRRGVRD